LFSVVCLLDSGELLRDEVIKRRVYPVSQTAHNDWNAAESEALQFAKQNATQVHDADGIIDDDDNNNNNNNNTTVPNWNTFGRAIGLPPNHPSAIDEKKQERSPPLPEVDFNAVNQSRIPLIRLSHPIEIKEAKQILRHETEGLEGAVDADGEPIPANDQEPEDMDQKQHSAGGADPSKIANRVAMLKKILNVESLKADHIIQFIS
jgi:hypothetical protein